MQRQKREDTFRRLEVGNLELYILNDGYQSMIPAHPIFGPYEKKADVEQLLSAHSRPVDRVDLGLHVLLIRKGERLIMIDSGLGSEDTTGGRLSEAFAVAGLFMDQVTDIVVTHCHTDHIGGLVTGDGKPAFSAAVVHVAKTEYDFWMSDEPDFSASPLKDHPVMVAGLIGGVRRLLAIVRPQLRFFDGDSILFDCIQLMAAPGHTPGHTVMTIFSDEEKLFHSGDIVHSDVLLFPHPEWGILFDVDWRLAGETRRKFFGELAATNARMLTYHLPWPGLGRVRYRGEGFEWIGEG